VDIACLSTRIPFYEMLKCYERKFPQANVIRPFKALTYFDDIDFGEDIVMLNFEYDWKQIARRLKEMTVDRQAISTKSLSREPSSAIADSFMATISSMLYKRIIDFGEDIVMLNFEYDWKQIARRLKEMTVRQEHIFSQWPLKEQKRPVAEDKDMTSMKRGRKR